MMTQEQEEELLFQKVVSLKKERDMLYNIFEQLDKKAGDSYTCKRCNKKMSGVWKALEEYKQWRK